MAIQNWRNTLSQLPEESSPARSGRGVAGSLPSPTIVGQMIGTSDMGGAFKVSASPNVSADIQRAFIQRIVYRQWDFRNPLAAGEQAVYLYQLSKTESLFGWLYSESAESSTAAPYFICCYLAEPLNATQLENILLWLQVGPADPSHSHASPTTVTDLHAPDLWNHRPARPGVAVPEALVLQSLDKLERGELIDLFVPASQLESLSAAPAPVLPVFPTETGRPSGPPRRPRRAPAFSGVGLLTGVLIGGGVAIGLALLLLLDPAASRSNSKSTPERDRNSTATSLPVPVVASSPVADAAPATQTPTRPPVAKPLPTRPTTPPKDRPAETRPATGATTPPHPEVAAIPGLPTGTLLSEVEAIWGTAQVRKGYWPNTEAAIYEFAPEQITVGYVFDRDSKRVRQSEIAFAQTVEPTMIRQTLSQILGAEANPTIMQGLKRVYQRQTSRYTFRTDSRKGVIERNAQDRIYIGVWEADLH